LRTNNEARLCVSGRFLHVGLGAAWAFNNSKPHGMLNRGPERWHLILDLPDTQKVRDLIHSATLVDGSPDEEALAQLAADPLEKLTPAMRQDASLVARLERQ
jgi:hypothetical protein